MKRFSKVVRHPHKLTQWSAGIKTRADKNKKKTRVIFSEETRLSPDDRRNNEDSFSDVQHVYIAWNALKKARKDEDTLINILEVLLNSCVNPCECVYESVVFGNDVRAMLCDKNLVCQMLVELSDHWEEAIGKLSMTVATRETLLENKPKKSEEISVDLLRLFGWTSMLGEEEIASHHLSDLMPWLSDQDNLTARILCDDWERLPNQFAGKILFAISHPQSLRSWMDSMLTLNAKEGRYLLWVLLDHGLETEVVTDNVAPLLSRAFHDRRVLCNNTRVIQCVVHLMKGMSAARLRCLLSIEKYALKRMEGHCSNKEGIDDYEAIKPFLIYFTADQTLEAWAGEFSTKQWQYAANRMKHHGLDHLESEHFATLMLNQCDYLSGDEQMLQWYIDATALAFKTVDKKFYKKLEDLLYYRFNCGESLKEWESMMKMALIVCTPKMSPTSSLNTLFITLNVESAEDLFIEKLLLKSWQSIDQYCRSENRGDMLTKGIDKLFDHGRSFISLVIRGFNAAPSTTLKAISDLGVFPSHLSQNLFQWLEHHPLYGQNSSDISQRCRTVEYFAEEHPSVDLPKKLISTLGANKELSSLRKELREKEEQKLEAAEMRMLFTAISDHLSLSLSGMMDSEEVNSYSVAMMTSARRNRRGGKRALKRHYRMGETARLFHPSNILWLKNPKTFWRPSIWIKGISETFDLEKIGAVTIETEHRLDEILKMGTYVNSCLSIGGCNQHSAIANAVDANKRVLFMRDADGKFIARQLLAITKERKLACFMIYHSGHQYDRKLIQDSFARLDQLFATKLGLAIQEEDDYEIERVICKDWYDDGIWVPSTEEEAS